MDEGRHNDSHDGRKRPPERKPRFQFSLERRPEAIRAPLPKLGSSSKPVVTLLYDDVFSVSVDDGPDFGKGVKIEPGKVFKRLEISEEEVSLIASKFDFSDRTLLRVLIGIAGDQSRPSEDYGVSNGVL